MAGLVLANGSVLVAGRFVPADVVVEGSRIVSIEHGASADGEVVDCRGRFVVPGLVDLHVGGGGGRTFSIDVDEESFGLVARAHGSSGTTALCPTIAAAAPDTMLAAIALAADLCERPIPGGAEFVGIHLDGPFLAADRCLAHIAAHVRPPSLELARKLVEAGRGWIRLVTLAPELDGALPVIRYLASEGIHVSAGHTGADADTMYTAMAAGLGGVTNLLHDMEPIAGRAPGPGGVALSSSLHCGLVADLVHLDADVVRTVLATRAAGHTYLVSNAAAPLGTDEVEHRLPGERVIARDSGCFGPDGELIGGTTPLSHMVRTLIRELEATVADAVGMASVVPARLIGLRDRGEIRPGAVADLLIIERHRVDSVVLRGQLIESWPNYKRLW
jgi:N-acetylglucosamine-6-phosphate deacetylase